MKIIPAIDLRKGECVRLKQGDFNQITHYAVDPITCAKQYEDFGAKQLHVVDLDGAKNETVAQEQLIINIAQSNNLKIQTGGGIRTEQQIEKLLKHNIERIVIGSLAVKKPAQVQQWMNTFGNDRIVIALDVRYIQEEYYCATQGWKGDSTITLWDCLAYYDNLKFLLCTDIERDGTLSGPNIKLYQKIKALYPAIQLQASGGIASLSDLQRLSAINVDGVIIGKALYEKRFTLSDALSISEGLTGVM